MTLLLGVVWTNSGNSWGLLAPMVVGHSPLYGGVAQAASHEERPAAEAGFVSLVVAIRLWQLASFIYSSKALLY